MIRLSRGMLRIATLFGAVFGASFAVATYCSIEPAPSSLEEVRADAHTVDVVDRHGRALTVTYQNRWNSYDVIALHRVPEFLKIAFLISEDRRFFDHCGVDWWARLGALRQNIAAGHLWRGASTITEQVVRMLHPRPRTLWSKWIEGIEASALEESFSKAQIFEFYLNQIPYASNRRGVVQAARYYFDRDLSTLSRKEMIALVVLARAPSSYDLYRDSKKIEQGIARVAARLVGEGVFTAEEADSIATQTFELSPATLPVQATHFVRYVREHSAVLSGETIKTTLDGWLQSEAQRIVDERIGALKSRAVRNGAALVVDHQSGEVLAWVVGGALGQQTPGRELDTVTTPRQPGSALKPFLYTAALDSGWSPATILEDAPFAESVGSGLHSFRNYSNTYYGKVSLREALGNSLNIPALHAIEFVGTTRYLTLLHSLGFRSLTREADIYDEGLALGNGEVTLLELVRGYVTLANRGVLRALRWTVCPSQNIAHTLMPIHRLQVPPLISSMSKRVWGGRVTP